MSKRVLRVVLVACGILVASVVFVYACTNLETPQASFATYEDAVKRGAMGSGKWLPTWLPQTATDIREAHNIDTNFVWLEFKQPGVLHDIKGQCQAIDQRSMEAALPNMASTFPGDIRENRARLVGSVEVEAISCSDTKMPRNWIVVRLKGDSSTYAWTPQVQ
ncbi:MAG TPA: hypothetical protein VLJ86_01945 [Ramlibacter sp.]|nr:hypothetical protein [Ramlibacter sp.]